MATHNHNYALKPANTLLTGAPGCGKTTVVVKTARLIAPLRVSGFYTEEIREGRSRVGFKIVTFGGEEGILSHVEFKGGPKVAKYTVDLKGFERIALPALADHADTDVFIIDEIGKMECFSQRFRQAVGQLIAGRTAVLATIARKGAGIISELKTRHDVDLIEVTHANRDELPAALARRIRSLITQSPPKAN